MKIAIFIADSNGGYPVPAVKGGAVSVLVEHLVKGNNSNRMAELDIISLYDKEAEKLSKQYPNVNFIWIKERKIIKLLDNMLFNFVRFFLKKKKAVSYKSIFLLMNYVLKSNIILRRNNYDKVVLENNLNLAWIIKLSKYSGEYYYHFHNIPRINPRCNSVFDNCTGYICVSEFIAECLCDKNSVIGKIPKQKTRVLYNCIDTKQYRPIEEKEKIKLRKKYSIAPNDTVISFVGRLTEEKGIDKLLEAVKLIEPNVKVIVTGSLMHNMEVVDEYQKKIFNLSKELGDKIVFTGYISHKIVQEVYQIADIAVLPSVWEEPAGLTMVEAASCGIPVITTNSGGIPEYMKGLATILEKDDKLIRNIAITIENIIEDSDDMQNKEKIHTIVEKKFSSDNYWINFLEVLK